MRQRLTIVGVVVMTVVLVLMLVPGCGKGETPAPGVTPTPGTTPVKPTPTPQAKTLKIGSVGALSGPAAAWGVDVVLGVNWAIDEVNTGGGVKVGNDRYMIELVQCDNKFAGSGSTDCATRLVYDEGIHYVVGPTWFGDAVDPIFTQGKTFYSAIDVVFMPSPESPYRLNAVTSATAWEDNWYRLCHQFHPEVKTVVAIAPQTQGEAFIEGAQKVAPALGITILDTVLYPAGTTDFYPVLTSILAKNPDAIEGCSGPPGEFALIVKQARELGYKGWFWFGCGAPTSTFLEVAGPANAWKIATNIEDYTALIYSGRVQELNREWLQKYASPPGRTDLPLVTTSAYNIVMLYKAAIEKAGSIEPDKVMQVMDDPNFTFDTFAAEDVRLGGIQSYGIRRQIPHATAYGEIVDANNVHLSMGEILADIP